MRAHWSDDATGRWCARNSVRDLAYPPDIQRSDPGERSRRRCWARGRRLRTAAACLPRPVPGSLAQKVPSPSGSSAGPTTTERSSCRKAYTASVGFSTQLVDERVSAVDVESPVNQDLIVVRHPRGAESRHAGTGERPGNLSHATGIGPVMCRNRNPPHGVRLQALIVAAVMVRVRHDERATEVTDGTKLCPRRRRQRRRGR